jgi:hypothetical protein
MPRYPLGSTTQGRGLRAGMCSPRAAPDTSQGHRDLGGSLSMGRNRIRPQAAVRIEIRSPLDAWVRIAAYSSAPASQRAGALPPRPLSPIGTRHHPVHNWAHGHLHGGEPSVAHHPGPVGGAGQLQEPGEMPQPTVAAGTPTARRTPRARSANVVTKAIFMPAVCHVPCLVPVPPRVPSHRGGSEHHDPRRAVLRSSHAFELARVAGCRGVRSD